MAFLEGRSILGNVIRAYEITHYLKCKRKGKHGDIALKIAISKAYYQVDWGYLRDMMPQLGFEPRWVNWIILCNTSVNYSIMVNSETVGPIKPSRGLR